MLAQPRPSETPDDSTDNAAKLRKVIATISEIGGSLGLELVSVAGTIDEVVARHAQQMDRLDALTAAADRVAQQNAEVMASARQAEAALSKSSRDTARRIEATMQAMTAWVESAEGAMENIAGLAKSLASVDTIAKSIETIAANTNLLALNATIEAASHQVRSDAGHLAADVKALDGLLGEGGRRLDRIAVTGESIMQATSEAGVACADSRFIELARDAAARIGTMFEKAIDEGRVSVDDLFDSHYAPIAGTEPQQYMTRFVALTDQLLPDLQEATLGEDGRIAFCAAVDRNGFLATHNRKFSQPQRANDPAWNAANCRNRRLFNDRVGKRAGANAAAPLVQAYRRDMGNGQFMMMKDISAPVFVCGRHWGGFRIGVKL